MRKRNIKQLELLPPEHKFVVTTTMNAKSYIKMLKLNLGIDDLIRRGLDMIEQTPIYVERIRELEKTTQKQGDSIMRINHELLEVGMRFEKLKQSFDELKEYVLIKIGGKKDDKNTYYDNIIFKKPAF